MIVLLALLIAADTSGDWTAVKDKEGIQVWAREVPGSSIREVRAETIVTSTAERVWEVLLDVSGYVEFMPYLVEASVLGAAGKNARYEYQLVDPPFVSRRDYILRVSIEEYPEQGYYRRSWAPAPGVGPATRPGVVRLTVCQGSWTVERLDAGHTRVAYWLFTDPGGSIPNWIANRANATSVPELMQAVRNRAANPLWQRD